MAIYTDSLEGKLKTLQATWEQFVLDLQASEAFKIVIDLGTQLISLLDILLNKIPVLSNLIKIGLAAGAVGVLISSLQKLLGMLGVFSTAEKVITGTKTTITGLKAAASAFSAVIQGGTGVVSALTFALSAFDSATGAATVTMAGFIASIAPLLAIGAAVGLVAFIGYLNSAEKAAKDAEKALKDYNEQEQKIESAQSELDTINDKIAEINAKDGITLTDKKELENLKEQRTELEALIAAYETLAETSKGAALEAQKESIRKTYAQTKGGIFGFGAATGFNTGTAKDYSGKTETDLRDAYFGYSTSKDLDVAVGLYKQYTELQQEARKNGKELSDQSQKDFGKISQDLTTNLQNLEDQKATLEALGDTSSEEYQRVVGLIDMILQATAPEQWRDRQLTKLLLGDDASEAAKNAKEQIDTLRQELADGLIDEDTYKQKLTDLLTTLANDPTIRDGLSAIFGEDFMENAGIDEIVNTLAEGFGEKIPSAADATVYKIDDIKSGLSDLDDRLGNLKSGISDLGDVDFGAIDNVDDFNTALAQGEDLINSYQNELDGLQGAYDSLGANVDAAGVALDFLSTNMDDIINSADAGYKAVNDVITGAGQLVDVVDTATGETINLQNEITAIMTDTTLTQQQKQEAVVALQGRIQTAGNNTITTMNAVIDAIIKVKQELAAALNAAASFVDNAKSALSKVSDSWLGGGVLRAFGFSTDDIEKAASGLTGVADSLRDKSKEITDSILNDKAELIKGTEEYQAKLDSAAGGAQKAYKKVQDAANKAGSSGSGSTKKQTDATKELTDALKEEYEAQKAILDAQKKQLQNQKDLLNQEKSDLADAKNAIQDLIDMTMRMLKQEYQNRIDILEKQIDSLQDDLSNQQDQLEKAYDKQTEALENQLDAFNEKIDAQKEYLKLQKEEQDHAEQLSEKNQAIADVQAQLEELRYDNSAAAQKKRLELLDNLNDAQKDLTDYQTQYDYDTKVDGLDKEQSAFQKQMEDEKTALKDRYDQEKQQIEDTYNARIEALEKEKDYIKNTLMDEYNLYQEAISLIQGRSDEFYNRLVE